MAEDSQANPLSSAFPAPPPFYKHFTPSNLAQVAEARPRITPPQPSTNGDGDSDGAHPQPATIAARLGDLPPELRFLLPPDPPTTGIYHSFGDRYNIHETLPSLRSQGVEQLFPTPQGSPATHSTPHQHVFDRQAELTKLARSMLLSFLELVGVLAVDVERYPAKLEDLRVLFVNAHHLINEYRPHQARETLIALMEDEVRGMRAEVEGVRRMGEKVEEVLGALAGEGEAVGVGVDVELPLSRGQVEEGRRAERMERVWGALDAIEI